jgi:hypothetical protein
MTVEISGWFLIQIIEKSVYHEEQPDSECKPIGANRWKFRSFNSFPVRVRFSRHANIISQFEDERMSSLLRMRGNIQFVVPGQYPKALRRPYFKLSPGIRIWIWKDIWSQWSWCDSITNSECIHPSINSRYEWSPWSQNETGKTVTGFRYVRPKRDMFTSLIPHISNATTERLREITDQSCPEPRFGS